MWGCDPSLPILHDDGSSKEPVLLAAGATLLVAQTLLLLLRAVGQKTLPGTNLAHIPSKMPFLPL